MPSKQKEKKKNVSTFLYRAEVYTGPTVLLSKWRQLSGPGAGIIATGLVIFSCVNEGHILPDSSLVHRV